MKLILLFFLLIKNAISYKFSVLDGYSNTPICNENKCGAREHTYCFSDKISENCKKFEYIKLTAKDVNTIILGHNGLRNRVSNNFLRPSSNMNVVHWDYYLEAMARKWLIQCTLKADECGFIFNSTFTVGQNIHFFPKFNFKKQNWAIAVIRSWYLEGNSFDSELLTNMVDGK